MATVNGSPNDDTLYGTGDHDTINAIGGHDTLKGFGGADILNGGDGIDIAFYDDSTAGVAVNLTTGQGFGGSAAGDTLIDIEYLYGSNHNDTLTGDDGVNDLYGLNGTDILKGAGGADGLDGGSGDDILKGGGGADFLVGGAGNDTADYSQAPALEEVWGVIINLQAGTAFRTDAEGDTLIGIENLTGTQYHDVLTGSDVSNALKGLDGHDHLHGLGGNDRLEGGNDNDQLDGGTGIDTMLGGRGGDTYFVDDAADQVLEAGGEGTDTLRTSVSYALAAGSEVDLITTTNQNDTAAINLTGNEFNSIMFGNAGDNIIVGGAGIDNMSGREGSDTYFVDNSADLVFDYSGYPGIDTVITSASFALYVQAQIEVLRTLGSTSKTAIDLTGNGFAQTLLGNAAANTLNGLGGADNMQGFDGNDTYFVENTADIVVETAGNGADRIIVTTNLAFTLAAGVDVELLRTPGSASVFSVNLHGNEIVNTIQGNNGANVLSGGLGSDTMTGFGDTDVFRFNTTLGAANIDAVTDFNVTDDLIQIDNAVFAGLAVGTLDADAFHIGATAADAEDRIIYDSATGALTFDSNGSGGGGATQFAILTAGLAMTNADISVI